MTAALPLFRPVGAALIALWGRRLMDVILHVGAHRTATTSFQHVMRGQGALLAQKGARFWSPRETRNIVFPGLFRTAAVNRWRQVARRAEGRVRLHCVRAEREGVRTLIVSDENMIGTCAQNLRTGSLYPAIGERMARVTAAFDGRVRRIVLTVRALELWWASAAALTASRGHALPDAARCTAIARAPRGWREVVTDLACAAPEAEILVQPFEDAPGQPQVLLQALTGWHLAQPLPTAWRNRSPDKQALRRMRREMGADVTLLGPGQGRYQPFSPAQCAALHETYADDLHWLCAGADGLARLTEKDTPARAGSSLPRGQMTEGQSYDEAKGHLAQHR